MSYWAEPLKIGKLRLSRFIGGPLDGITDSPFRRLVREYSPDELLYTEMRHIGCVAHEKAGIKALNFAQMERPLNYQIAANTPEFIVRACEKILAQGVDAIDLNIGCPAKNVVNSGSGSALMGDLPRLKTIVTLLRQNIPTVPFTVKIRAGYKKVNALEVAQLLEDCGVDAIALHPRLQTQLFEGRPDYALAAQVKRAISIPLIISGGVVNFKTARMVYEQTGVDGYLIGRGIWARPWKLKELREHSLGNHYEISQQEIFSCALRHLEYMLEYYGDHGLFAYRKHLPFYLKGLAEASSLRSRLVLEKDPRVVRNELLHLMQG